MAWEIVQRNEVSWRISAEDTSASQSIMNFRMLRFSLLSGGFYFRKFTELTRQFFVIIDLLSKSEERWKPFSFPEPEILFVSNKNVVGRPQFLSMPRVLIFICQSNWLEVRESQIFHMDLARGPI